MYTILKTNACILVILTFVHQKTERVRKQSNGSFGHHTIEQAMEASGK